MTPKEQLLEDLRELIKTPVGRRVLKAILAESQPLKLSYVPGDSHASAFNEGVRAPGIWLFKFLELAERGSALKIINQTEVK